MKGLRRTLSTLLTLSLAIGLDACAEDSNPLGPETAPTENTSSRTINGVQYTVTTPKAVYAPGEEIVTTFRVRNLNATSVTYRFNSTRQHDLTVDEAGTEVWRWSRDRVFGRAMTTITLKNGETRTWTDTWNQDDNDGIAVGPGTYQIAGLVPDTSNGVESAPLQVTIR